MTDTDYEDLLNTVQRHTRCSSVYCLKRKANDSEAKCRFNFPIDRCDNTTLQFEPIHTKDKTEKYKIQIATKRNDTRLYNHQHLQLQGCRANCDIQVVTDYHACVYARRQQYQASAKQDLMALNFLEFATSYKFSNGKLINQPDNIIPRVFPTFSSNPKGPNYGLYCKYQLIRHKPWSVTQDSAWGNKEESDETFITEWKAFLQTPYAQSHVPDSHDKLQEIEIHSEQSL